MTPASAEREVEIPSSSSQEEEAEQMLTSDLPLTLSQFEGDPKSDLRTQKLEMTTPMIVSS